MSYTPGLVPCWITTFTWNSGNSSEALPRKDAPSFNCEVPATHITLLQVSGSRSPAGVSGLYRGMDAVLVTVWKVVWSIYS